MQTVLKLLLAMLVITLIGLLSFLIYIDHQPTFNQRILYKQAHDFRPEMIIFNDKLKCREYVQKRGVKVAPLLFEGEKATDIPFDKLPTNFVVKTNHGCDSLGLFIIKDGVDLVRNQHVTQSQIIQEMTESLKNTSPCIGYGFENIIPKIMVETYLENDDGSPIDDYKIYVFHGKAQLCHVDLSRFSGQTQAFYDRNWQRLPFRNAYKGYQEHNVPKPEKLAEVLAHAEALAGDMDFVRVDFYLQNGEFFFSELSPYSHGGHLKFEPSYYDTIVGQLWQHTDNY